MQSLQNKVSPHFLKYKFSRIYQERNEVSQSMKWQKTNLLRKKEGTKPDNSKWPAFKCETRRISLRARWGIPMVGEEESFEKRGDSFFAGNCRQLNNSWSSWRGCDESEGREWFPEDSPNENSNQSSKSSYWNDFLFLFFFWEREKPELLKILFIFTVIQLL